MCYKPATLQFRKTRSFEQIRSRLGLEKRLLQTFFECNLTKVFLQDVKIAQTSRGELRRQDVHVVTPLYKTDAGFHLTVMKFIQYTHTVQLTTSKYHLFTLLRILMKINTRTNCGHSFVILINVFTVVYKTKIKFHC